MSTVRDEFEDIYPTPDGLDYDDDQDTYVVHGPSEINQLNAITYNGWYRIFKAGAATKRIEVKVPTRGEIKAAYCARDTLDLESTIHRIWAERVVAAGGKVT